MRNILTLIAFFVVLLNVSNSHAIPKNRVIISSGPVMPAGLSKKPEGFFGNLLGDKYILNDLQIEGISAFPPGKVFSIYQSYLKQVVDIEDIKFITEEIKKLYMDNDLPAPKIVLPLSRFTPNLAVIEVLEPRALKRIHADPATLGEILKKQEAKKKVLAAARAQTALPQAIPETEVAPSGIATSIQEVEDALSAPPLETYSPEPHMIESLDVIGSKVFDPAYLKSLALPLVDRLFNINDLLELTVNIQNAYRAKGQPLPNINLSLVALLDKRIVLYVNDHEANAGPAPKVVQKIEAQKNVEIVAAPASSKEPATKDIIKQKPTKIERTEVERGIFLIAS